MRFRGPLALAALAFMGCAAVSVEGVRRANDSHALVEPIAVVIFQSSTPASHSQVLQRTLSSELQRRGLLATFTIVSSSEEDEPGVAATAFRDASGAILIAPSDGSARLNGVVAPVYYDVRALRILEHPGPAVPGSGPNGTTPINDGKGRVTPIWRGRAYARGGFANENLADVASQIVVKLIADHVLRGTPQPLPPETPRKQ